MKNQVLFSSKDKSKKLKCRLLQFLFGALRVKSKSAEPCLGIMSESHNSDLRSMLVSEFQFRHY